MRRRRRGSAEFAACSGEAERNALETDKTLTVKEAIKDYIKSERDRNAKAKEKAVGEECFVQAYMALEHFTGEHGIESKTVSGMNAPDVARYAERENLKGADAELRLRHVKDFLDYLKKRGLHEKSLRGHVKIRPVAKGEKQTATVGVQAVEVTESGLDARKKELEDLKAQRPEIIAAIRTAAADKDYRENAPLDVAREEQGKVEARIRELEEEIRRAEVVETSSGSRAGVGARVSLHGLDDGTTKAYTLVDPIEANPSEGKLSIKSPVGEAVVGKRKGNQVTIKTPSGGERRYRIEDITVGS